MLDIFIIILKVLLTIVLIPIKVVFFVFAYIMRLITYLLSIFLSILAEILEIIGMGIAAFLSIGAIIGTVYFICQISSGTLRLGEGVFLILGMWITLSLLVAFGKFLETISEAIDSFGELLTDWAKANWFEYWY